jgi:hypothetical protein
MTVAAIRTPAAVGYVLAACGIQLAAFFADPYDAEGYVYFAVFLTAPWSLGVLMLSEPVHAVVEPIVGEQVAFDIVNVATLLIGVSINAILVAGIDRFVNWVRRSPAVSLSVSLALTMAVFLGMVVAYPRIQAEASERRRPANVPRSAVAWGSWAWHWCEFVAETNVDHCIVWDRRGNVRYDEEFVPADGGPPARQAELVIVETGGADDQIGLSNGRVLWPRSEFARKLDLREKYGPRQRAHFILLVIRYQVG